MEFSDLVIPHSVTGGGSTSTGASGFQASDLSRTESHGVELGMSPSHNSETQQCLHTEMHVD